LLAARLVKARCGVKGHISLSGAVLCEAAVPESQKTQDKYKNNENSLHTGGISPQPPNIFAGINFYQVSIAGKRLLLY
jgi:hypothetical protein